MTAFNLGHSSLRRDIGALFEVWDALWHQTPECGEFTAAGVRFAVRATAESGPDLTGIGVAQRSDQPKPGSEARILCLSTADGLSIAWSSELFHERECERELAASSMRLHYFPDCQFWQVFDVATGRGLQLSDNTHGAPPWEDGAPLRNFVAWSVASKTRSLLHGGTLCFDGRGYLVAGQGGAGKSSLTIQSIARGIPSAGDDYVVVDTQGPTALPVFNTLKQDRAGLARLSIHP